MNEEVERWRNGKERTQLKDVRVSGPTEFRCFRKDGSIRTYRTKTPEETADWLRKLCALIADREEEGETNDDDDEKTSSSSSDVSDRRRKTRPRSMRATHSLDDLRRLMMEWASKRSKDPHFRADVTDISMTSPDTFTVALGNERRVYRTSSAKATEEWIEKVSEFAETPLRTLLINGAKPPTWVPDEDRVGCSVCKLEFNFFLRRRHHCRSCGEVVCYACSSDSLTLPWLGIHEPVRICDYCVRHYSEMLVFWHSRAAENEDAGIAKRVQSGTGGLHDRLSGIPSTDTH